jgi:hypothetical protein
VTVAAGYLLQAQSLGFSAVMAFYFGHICADFSWNTVLSAVVGGGRRWMTQNVYRSIIAACALFFIYLGFGFLLHGMQLVGL